MAFLSRKIDPLWKEFKAHEGNETDQKQNGGDLTGTPFQVVILSEAKGRVEESGWGLTVSLFQEPPTQILRLRVPSGRSAQDDILKDPADRPGGRPYPRSSAHSAVSPRVDAASGTETGRSTDD